MLMTNVTNKKITMYINTDNPPGNKYKISLGNFPKIDPDKAYNVPIIA